MSRSSTMIALALSFASSFAAVGPLPAYAAEAAQRVVRLALVDPGSTTTTTPDVKAFWERLSELGYIEGRNLVVESRFADGRLDQLPSLMADVLARKVDVLVVLTTPAAIAAKNATNTVPIVAAPMADPVGVGLVPSLARPAGNLTGLSVAYEEGLAGKWLELLQEAVPSLSTAAVTANPDVPSHRDMLKQLEAIAPTRGLRLQIIEVRNPEALDHAFELARRTAQAVVVLADPISLNNRTRVTMLAAKYQLPAVYGLRDFVDAGGLMAYAVDQLAMFRRAADYVDRILTGAKPADLPIERVTRYRLILNLKTAKALRLTFPESIRARADEVMQ